MVSKAVIITVTLLLATLAVAITGYILYKGYYDIYESLNKPQNLTYILNRVKSLEYTVSINNHKAFVYVYINKSSNMGTIKVTEENGTSSFYRFYFDPVTGIYKAEKKEGSSNYTTLDLTSFIENLERGINIGQGGLGSVNITVEPSLAPLTILYDIAKGLNISWIERRGPSSTVTWEPLTYTFNGVKYKGILVDVRVTTSPYATSMWDRVSDIRVIVIHMDDLKVFPFVEIIVGGNLITFNLTSINFSE